MASARRESFRLGLVFIGLVVLIWTLSSVLVQYIYKALSFDSPFLLTYLCSILFAVYLPPHAVYGLRGLLRKRQMLSSATLQQNVQVEFQPLPTNEEMSVDSHQTTMTARSMMSAVDTLRASAAVVVPWFLAQYTYNASLRFTSITSNTVISTSSSLYTFLFGIIFLGERFTCLKLGALLVCLSGAAVTCAGDHLHSGTDTLWGDVVCLVSAVLYGAYTTVMRAFVEDDEACSMTLLFGFVGLLSATLIGPAVFMLHQACGHHNWLNHVKPNDDVMASTRGNWTSSSAVAGLDGISPLVMWHHLASVPLVIIGWVVTKGLFQNVLADYLWARSIVLTSPTVATMGLSMTIPAAMIADFLLGKGVPSAHAFVGAALMCTGFVAYSSAARKEEQIQEKQKFEANHVSSLSASEVNSAAEAQESSCAHDDGVELTPIVGEQEIKDDNFGC